jgi:hypothetical protein
MPQTAKGFLQRIVHIIGIGQELLCQPQQPTAFLCECIYENLFAHTN